MNVYAKSSVARRLYLAGHNIATIEAALGINKARAKELTRFGLEALMRPLLEQQKAEVARVRGTFDYSVFAGKRGPLSGAGCRAALKGA